MSNNLLFMPDFGADPIWDTVTECMVSLEQLPIEENTRSAIRALAARWEELASQEMHVEDDESGILADPAEPVPKQACESIEHDGRALCQKLRDELGDGWRVGWVTFEGDQRHVQWDASGPVMLFPPGSGEPE